MQVCAPCVVRLFFILTRAMRTTTAILVFLSLLAVCALYTVEATTLAPNPNPNPTTKKNSADAAAPLLSVAAALLAALTRAL